VQFLFIGLILLFNLKKTTEICHSYCHFHVLSPSCNGSNIPSYIWFLFSEFLLIYFLHVLSIRTSHCTVLCQSLHLPLCQIFNLCMFGFYVPLCVFHFTACKFDFYVLILQEILFVHFSSSRNGSVHDAKYCFKL